MAHLDLLAEAAAIHPAQGSNEQPAAVAEAGRKKQKKRQPAARAGSSRGGSPPASAGGTGSGGGSGLTKAAIMARVVEEHSARISEEDDAALAQWASDTHEQADGERTTARDAYRADQRSEHKAAEWHAKVAAAQAAHDSLRQAREALYRLQALAELLAKELQRRRAVLVPPSSSNTAPAAAAASAGAAPAAGGGAAGWGSGGCGSGVVEERLLALPATQGTKRKRGAPPEECPYCCHSYTVRDGLSTRMDTAGNRLHLRRCQCRTKTPPCRNCPECKQRLDVMQLAPDAEAAYELCQRAHACAICACKCPGAGKWVEGDNESRRAFKDRTQKRQEELVELGWQDASTAPPLPASTADGTASVATATPSASAAAGTEVQRPRRQQPSKSSMPSTRRLPADIRQELEQMQQYQRQQETPAHSHQQARTSGHLSQQSRRQEQLREPPPHPQQAHLHAQQQQAQQHMCCHHPEHLHTCSHPHADCTSECCSMVGGGEELGEGGPEQQQPSGSLAALAAALEAAQQMEAVLALPPATLGAVGNTGLLRIWEQLAAAAALQMQQQPPPGLQQPRPAADAAPELPSEVVALVDEVFLHTKGEAGAAAVATFLRSQCLTSLSDFEFLELGMLERGLGDGMPTLLLNKFLQLGRKRGTVGAAPAGAELLQAAAAGGALTSSQQQQQLEQVLAAATGSAQQPKAEEMLASAAAAPQEGAQTGMCSGKR